MKLLFAPALIAVLFSTPALADDAKTAPKKPDKSSPKKPAAKKKTPPLPFKTSRENTGYGIGLDLGRRVMQTMTRQLSSIAVDRKKLVDALAIKKDLVSRLKERGVELDAKRMHEGFRDALSGAKPKMTDLQIMQVYRDAQRQINAKMKLVAEEHKKLAEKNKKEGPAFLAKNKKREGVVTTKSGLQYEVLRKGTGKKPKLTDTVIAKYRGTLIDGTEFDSSKKHGGPQPIRVGGVIRGWQEALQLMRVGAKWKLFVPAELAYRDESRGRLIAPHAVLIFELELLEIK